MKSIQYRILPISISDAMNVVRVRMMLLLVNFNRRLTRYLAILGFQ